MPRRDIDEVIHATLHYNVRYVGGGLANRVTARSLKGTDPKVIEWVWIVEENRHATPKEIAQLCR